MKIQKKTIVVKQLTFKREVFSLSKTKRHIVTKISINACMYNAISLPQLHNNKADGKIRKFLSANYPWLPISKEKWRFDKEIHAIPRVVVQWSIGHTYALTATTPNTYSIRMSKHTLSLWKIEKQYCGSRNGNNKANVDEAVKIGI